MHIFEICLHIWNQHSLLHTTIVFQTYSISMHHSSYSIKFFVPFLDFKMKNFLEILHNDWIYVYIVI